MRLATIRTGSGTVAARVEGPEAVETDSPDVGTLLADPGWRHRAERAAGPRHDSSRLDIAPLIVDPPKIICVGMNYRSHIEEMGREPPDHPTFFAKYSCALVGAHDDIVLPRASSAVDWEVELAVVIGAPARHVDESTAPSVIAGFTVLNDVSMRDYQNRTLQWLQGKTFESSTPLGPELVTLDELAEPDALDLTCEVNGEVMQRGNTSDLVFPPATLIAYLSEIVTLMPGDIIATGTPSGVGHARTPPRYLLDGDVVVSRIDGVGECRNPCRAE
jgi:acylpyruvate hydrolase